MRELSVDEGFALGFENSAPTVLGEVPFAKADTNLLQECGRRLAASKNPHEVVGQSLLGTVHFEDNAVLAKFDRIGVEEYFQLAFFDAFLDTLRVAILDAAEGTLTVREGDGVADLMGKAHSGFDGGVTAPDDEDLLVDVMVGFDEAVHDFWEFLALDAELARTSHLAQSENDKACFVLALKSFHGKDAILILGDVLNLLAGAAFKIRALHDLGPELHKVLFGEFHFLELAIHREFHGTGHAHLLTGIFDARAADF